MSTRSRNRLPVSIGHAVLVGVLPAGSAIESVAVTVRVEARSRPPVVQLLPAGRLVLLCVAWGLASSVVARHQ